MIRVGHVYNEFDDDDFGSWLMENPHVDNVAYCTSRRNGHLKPNLQVDLFSAGERLRRIRLGNAIWRKAANIVERAGWKRFLARRRPDLLHVQHGHKAARWLPMLQRARLPLVVTFHGSDINCASFSASYVRELQQIFAHAAACHFVSRDLREHGLELGCPEHKAHAIHIGVPFSGQSTTYSPRTDNAVFVCVANLVPCKGHETLLRAFANVRKDLPRSQLHLFGEGPLQDRVAWLIERLGLKDAVTRHGQQPHAVVQEFLRTQADVLVLSSQQDDAGAREGMPMSLQEAGAWGVPSIGARCGGIPDFIQDGVTGYLVNQRSPDELATAMLRLAENPQRRERMGRAAQARVKADFHLQLQFAAFAALYRKALNLEPWPASETARHTLAASVHS